MSMFAWDSNIDPSPSQAGNAGAQQQQQRPLRWLPPNLVRSVNATPTTSSPLMTTLRQSPQIGGNPPLATLSGSNDPSLAEIGLSTPQVSSSVDVDAGKQHKPAEQRRVSSQPSMEGPSPVTTAQIATATAAAAVVAVPMPATTSRGDNTNHDADRASPITTPNGKKRGRLLTTSEETSLFQICNRHASTFGEHDRLCQWWATVASDFTSETGHPYSWHSVRRKVELVTKQRIKLLITLRESGGVDRAEGGWGKALEMWIPVWERFQEQEAQRSAGKGWRRGRKRKTVEVGLDGGDAVVASQPQPQPSQQPSQQQPQSQVGEVGVQLPSGFDSIFDQQIGQLNISRASMGKTKNVGEGLSDPTLSAALLETLSKLNRNLDARSSPITALGATPLHHTPSLDTHNGNTLAHNSLFGRVSGPIIDELKSELKEELKQELKQELRRDFLQQMQKDRAQMEERMDAVQRTHQMILELLQQEP